MLACFLPFFFPCLLPSFFLLPTLQYSCNVAEAYRARLITLRDGSPDDLMQSGDCLNKLPKFRAESTTAPTAKEETAEEIAAAAKARMAAKFGKQGLGRGQGNDGNVSHGDDGDNGGDGNSNMLLIGVAVVMVGVAIKFFMSSS